MMKLRVKLMGMAFVLIIGCTVKPVYAMSEESSSDDESEEFGMVDLGEMPDFSEQKQIESKSEHKKRKLSQEGQEKIENGGSMSKEGSENSGHHKKRKLRTQHKKLLGEDKDFKELKEWSFNKFQKQEELYKELKELKLELLVAEGEEIEVLAKEIEVLNKKAQEQSQEDMYEFKQKENKIIVAAVHKGDLSKVELCLKEGIDVNAQDEDGSSLLHVAVKKNNTKIVRLLIDHDADIKAKDKHGKMPLFYALKNKHEEIKKLLQDALQRHAEKLKEFEQDNK